MQKRITLNNYDQAALYDILLEVVQEKYDDFMALCEANGVVYECHSEKLDAEFLRMNCDSEMKKHSYYKAVILFAELSEELEEEN